MLDKLVAQLKLHEGVKLKPYRCTAGKLTIGVGRNLDDVGISMEEADLLLKNDIANVMRRCIGLTFWSELSENRKIVIIDMVFNLGWTRFLGFKKTIDLISKGKYEQASIEMLNSAWAKQVGKRAETLAKMMRQG